MHLAVGPAGGDAVLPHHLAVQPGNTASRRPAAPHRQQRHDADDVQTAPAFAIRNLRPCPQEHYDNAGRRRPPPRLPGSAEWRDNLCILSRRSMRCHELRPAASRPRLPPVRVNLYSDTQTRPTPAMKAAMMAAEVGDEQAGQDPTVWALCDRMASFLGKEAAVFLPSGTMCNQIAIITHCRPGDEILAHETAHILNNEGSGGAALAGAQITGLPRPARAVRRRRGARGAPSARPPSRAGAGAAGSGADRQRRRWRGVAAGAAERGCRGSP